MLLSLHKEELRLAEERQPYISVRQLLDEVSSKGLSPTGARGYLFAAIDGLRRGLAPKKDIELAERISVALHRLEWATLRKDSKEQADAQERLEELRAQWAQPPTSSAGDLSPVD